MSIFQDINYRRLFEYDTEKCSILGQEIVIFNCKNRVDLQGFPAQSQFSKVYLHAKTRSMTLFPAKEDDPVTLTHYASATDTNTTADMICEEIMNLFRRGHSMFLQDCHCRHRLAGARSVQLGLHCNTAENAVCCVRVKLNTFSDTDIQSELCVSSLDVATFGAMSIRQILVQSGLFVYTKNAWSIHPSFMLSSPEQILTFVRQHPCGIDEDHPFLDSMERDRNIFSLIQTGQLLRIPGVAVSTDITTPYRLFYGYAKHGQQYVDADIRAMWENAA